MTKTKLDPGIKVMTTLKKLCLSWGDFQNNLNTTVGELRHYEDFADVTLACEDGEEVRAHKIILAASSQYFKTLLSKNKHAHPLIYMRGVKSVDLLSMVDFIYFGEANVDQDNLEEFLKIAKELNIKGLHAEEKDVSFFEIQRNSTYNRVSSTKKTQVEPLESKVKTSDEQIEIKTEDKDSNRPEISQDIQEFNVKVKSIMVRADKWFYNKPGWKCSECGKEGSSSLIRDHIEVNHIKGIVIPCSSCKHTCKSRQALRKHNEKLHKGPPSEGSNRVEISQEIQQLNVKVKSLMVKADKWYNNKPGWKCSECGKEGSSSLIRDHIEVNHIEGTVIPCSSCDHTCRSRQALRRHMKNLHKDPPTEGNTN